VEEEEEEEEESESESESEEEIGLKRFSTCGLRLYSVLSSHFRG
jgi:hypothetical protein